MGWLGRPSASHPWGVVPSFQSLGRPRSAHLCSVHGPLAVLHRCARPASCCVRCPWPLGACSSVRVAGVSCVRRPRPLGSCSPVCLLGVLCCVCAVDGLFDPVHRWPARCAVLCLRCPLPLGSCSPVCPLVVLFVRFPWKFGSCSPVCLLGVLGCVCGVPDHLAPGHRSARSMCCLWGVLGHLAPAHRCASSQCCVAREVSLTTWLLFTRVPAQCVVLGARCAWPFGSCSPVCQLYLFCCLCSFPRPLGSSPPMCQPGALCCVCGVFGHLAPVHRCACSVCCVCGVVGHLASVHRCANTRAKNRTSCAKDRERPWGGH